MSGQLHVEMLGGLRVWAGETPVLADPAYVRRPWHLFCYLLLNPGKALPAAALAATLWPHEALLDADTLMDELVEDLNHEFARVGAALQPVDAVSGALMLLPRTLFDRIGGFDIGYRLHAEDLDLCRRARMAGATVAVANDVRVLHLRGVSSRSRPFFVEWHKHRGLWRYFRRFEAPSRALPVRLGVWLAIWARWLSRQPRMLLQALRGGRA